MVVVVGVLKSSSEVVVVVVGGRHDGGSGDSGRHLRVVLKVVCGLQEVEVVVVLEVAVVVGGRRR